MLTEAGVWRLRRHHHLPARRRTIAGGTGDACDLVALGVDSTRLNPEDLCHPTPCVFKCSSPTCGAEWPVPIFAPPEERQAVTVSAIRCSLRLQLRCLWDRYASTLLRMLNPNVLRGLHGSASIVVCILSFLVDAPPTARLGVWHLVAGWDSGVDCIDGLESTAAAILP